MNSEEAEQFSYYIHDAIGYATSRGVVPHRIELGQVKWETFQAYIAWSFAEYPAIEYVHFKDSSSFHGLPVVLGENPGVTIS